MMTRRSGPALMSLLALGLLLASPAHAAEVDIEGLEELWFFVEGRSVFVRADGTLRASEGVQGVLRPEEHAALAAALRGLGDLDTLRKDLDAIRRRERRPEAMSQVSLHLDMAPSARSPEVRESGPRVLLAHSRVAALWRTLEELTARCAGSPVQLEGLLEVRGGHLCVVTADGAEVGVRDGPVADALRALRGARAMRARVTGPVEDEAGTFERVIAPRRAVAEATVRGTLGAGLLFPELRCGALRLSVTRFPDDDLLRVLFDRTIEVAGTVECDGGGGLRLLVSDLVELVEPARVARDAVVRQGPGGGLRLAFPGAPDELVPVGPLARAITPAMLGRTLTVEGMAFGARRDGEQELLISAIHATATRAGVLTRPGRWGLVPGGHVLRGARLVVVGLEGERAYEVRHGELHGVYPREHVMLGAPPPAGSRGLGDVVGDVAR